MMLWKKNLIKDINHNMENIIFDCKWRLCPLLANKHSTSLSYRLYSMRKLVVKRVMPVWTTSFTSVNVFVKLRIHKLLFTFCVIFFFLNHIFYPLNFPNFLKNQVETMGRVDPKNGPYVLVLLNFWCEFHHYVFPKC